MKRIFVYRNGELVEKGSVQDTERSGPDIMKDIQPYQSQVTGEIITSRSRHREHLKQHNMVEVGNDSSLTKPYTGIPDTNPKQRKEILIREVNKFTHEEWKKAGKRELDRLRYNTRGIPER